jgi:hypothetical protein
MTRTNLWATFLLLTCGCTSSFHETHYFKSKVVGSGIPNYYRLTVDGNTAISSSRYVSGYFDEDTINTYFNEYTQPAGGAILPTPKNTGSAAEPVNEGLKGQKLIMILSSNSDEIATQIGALAASKQFTASLAGLIARDQYTNADAAESRLTIETVRAKTTASLASQLISNLPDNSPKADADSQLLGFLNSLTSDLGYDTAFSDLETAAQWLNFNRARILRGER